MADLTIKAHDTWKPLTATLTDASGGTEVPIDLTTATSVKVILKGTTVTVTGTCTFVDRANGKIQYAWVTGDTDTAGDYSCEFEIHWGDGTIETVPNDSYNTVTIKADLG